MTDDKVVSLYPELDDDMEKLSPELLTDAIVRLIRLADAEGVPLCVVAVENKESRRWATQVAFDEKLAMTGALHDMVDGLKQDIIILIDDDFDEGEL